MEDLLNYYVFTLNSTNDGVIKKLKFDGTFVFKREASKVRVDPARVFGKDVLRNTLYLNF